jgi:hypothetical protein
MSAASRDLFERSNSAADSRVSKTDRDVFPADIFDEFDERLLRIVRSIWPSKTAQHLALFGDITVRQASRILGREQGASGKLIRRFLMSVHGERVLWAIMDGTKVDWWKDFGYGRKLSAIQKQQRELDKERKRLESEL